MGDFSLSTLNPMTWGTTGDFPGSDWSLDLTGSKAAADAAKEANALALQAEERMFDESMDFNREQWEYQKGLYDEQKAAWEPWKKAGQRGLAGYEALLRDPSSVTQNPGYQFRLDQGAKTLGNSYLASGMGLSGTAGKGLQEYGQNYAMSEYDRALGRYNTLANYGLGAATGLQGSASNQGGLSQAYAGSLSNLYSMQGQNLSNYHMNQGQINANAAMAPWNTAMSLFNTGASIYNMMPVGNRAGGGGSVSPGGGDRSFLNPVGGYDQSVGFPY